MAISLAAQDYPLLNLFWTMTLFFFWMLWFVLLFYVIADIFRSHDLSGWAKTGWLVLVVVLPYLGVFVYVVARGDSMSHRRDQRAPQGSDQATPSHAQPTSTSTSTSSPSTAEELTKLAGLHDHGVLTDTEYNNQKAKLLA